MNIKFLKENKKTEEVEIEVTVNREERDLIKNHFKRKRCTSALIKRAIIEALKNYIKSHENKKGR